MKDTERKVSQFIEVDGRGRIVSAITTQEVAAAAMIYAGEFAPGHHLVALAGDPDSEWYDGNAVVPRPSNPSRQEGASIVDVPPESYVWFDGVRHLVDDGMVDLGGSQPGRYRIRIESFPPVDGVFEIEIST